MRKATFFNKDPLRTRKLLLHKREITKLLGQVSQKGYTIMPLQVYFKDSLVKVQIGLARGKKLYDKREDIAKKDQRREAGTRDEDPPSLIDESGCSLYKTKINKIFTVWSRL